MALADAFAACLPKKAAPIAEPEPTTAAAPKPRRSSKTTFNVGLPTTPRTSNYSTWCKYGLALATLALLWRSLFVVHTQTTDAIFVLVAIELLVWLRFRYPGRRLQKETAPTLFRPALGGPGRSAPRPQ